MPRAFRLVNDSKEEFEVIKGKTVLVTGSTSGIGLGIAQCFARQGASIVLNGFGEVEAAKAEVSRLGTKVGYHGADMSKPAEIEEMMRYAQDELRGVEITVQLSGI